MRLQLTNLDKAKKMLHALGVNIKPVIDFEKANGIEGKTEKEIEKELKDKYK